MYVFGDGRIIYGEENLSDEETGYVAAEKLPEIPKIPGKVGYHYAEAGEIKTAYFDIPPEPVSPDKPEAPATLEEIAENQLVIMAALAEIYEGGTSL